MKKIVWLTVMAGVAWLLGPAAGRAFAQSAEQASGVVREMAGDVQLKPEKASEFVPARPGSEVAQNTIVSTGFKSTAIIEVGSSTILVRPLTRLSLAEIQIASDTEHLNMNLQAGRVKVDVKPPAGTKTNFTVHSPTATASVRGTSFEFDTRYIRVSEGRVSFLGNSSGISIPVSAGSESFVGAEGRATDPAEIAEAAFQPPPPEGTDIVSKPAAPPSTGDFSISPIYPPFDR